MNDNEVVSTSDPARLPVAPSFQLFSVIFTRESTAA